MGNAFVKRTNAGLVGSTVQPAGSLMATNEINVAPLVSGGYATRLDSAPNAGLASTNFAKQGSCSVTLTGTTPVTLSLADLTSNSTASTGDTAFALWNELVFYNTGAADVTIAPGGSNPASLGLAGTTPSLTVAAGSKVVIESVAGVVVDATHKTILVTPTAGGSFALCVGGA